MDSSPFLRACARRALLPIQALGLAALLLLGACTSVRNYAVDEVGAALAGASATWSGDDDPELIRAAAPFSLKLIESLLAQRPEHPDLLLAAASGFTQYAYAFVQQDADFAEAESYARADELRQRARKLYLRARGYGLRALELAQPGLSAALNSHDFRPLAALRPEHVPALYWTGASWAAAINLAKDDSAAVAEFPIADALLERALSLDEGWNDGALPTLMISFESARASAPGTPTQRSLARYARALELSDATTAAPHVALAESVAVREQDLPSFRSLLTLALSIDPNRDPTQRLANLIAQQRARWLLSHANDLILTN